MKSTFWLWAVLSLQACAPFPAEPDGQSTAAAEQDLLRTVAARESPRPFATASGSGGPGNAPLSLAVVEPRPALAMIAADSDAPPDAPPRCATGRARGTPGGACPESSHRPAQESSRSLG